MNPTKYIIVLFLLCSSVWLFAQHDKVSNWLQTVEQTNIDSLKMFTLDSLASYYLDHNLDSAMLFVQPALELAKKIQHGMGQIESLNIYGNYYERKTLYDSAMDYYNKALVVCKKFDDTRGFAIIYNNIAIVKTRLGAYKEAMDLYFKALEAEEKIGNEVGIGEAYNNIGAVYYYMQDIPKTIEYLEKSIAVEEKIGNETVLLKGYNNIGALYDYIKNYKQALIYYQKSYDLSEKLDKKMDMSIALNNIAIIYYINQEYEAAATYYKRSLKLKEVLGDFRGIAHSYHNFANVEQAKGNVKKAESFYLKGLAIAKEKGLVNIESNTYKSLATLFHEKQLHAKAYEYLNKHLEMRDSVHTLDQSKAIAEVEAKYQTKKQENEILEQRARLAEKDLKLSQKNRQLILFAAITIVLILIAILFINQQRLRNKQLKQENELEEARAKIELQKQLEAQRLNISRDLHDNIASQITFVISSLDSLKYILRRQTLAVQKIDAICRFTKNTTHELRDTIWAMNKGFVQWQDIQDRMEAYITQANGMTDAIAFKFDLAKNIDITHNFSASEGMHIYRIMQEGINNSLKYAEATVIQLIISQKGDQLSIKIVDNGTGFDLKEIERGNGLFNMEKRVSLLKGSINIDTMVGRGTSIGIEIPIEHNLN